MSLFCNECQHQYWKSMFFVIHSRNLSWLGNTNSNHFLSRWKWRCHWRNCWSGHWLGNQMSHIGCDRRSGTVSMNRSFILHSVFMSPSTRHDTMMPERRAMPNKSRRSLKNRSRSVSQSKTIGPTDTYPTFQIKCQLEAVEHSEVQQRWYQSLIVPMRT